MSGVRVAVAVLTYRRPADIEALVPMLLAQSRGLPAPDSAYVLVVDNDPTGGARPVVTPHAAPDLRYVVETEPGISAARNRALREASDADLLVFIDDDERPTEAWLAALVGTQRRYGAAAVAARVASQIDGTPDRWITAGGFFDRRHRVDVPTGTAIDTAATNNLLLDLRVVRRLGLRFDSGFGLSGGEDSLFTRGLTGSGETMVWCAEAVVTESVPALRLTRRWVLLRSVSSGNSAVRVDLRLAAGARERASVRSRYLTAGVARVLAGLVRAAGGYLLDAAGGRSGARHQARGMRAAARGAGMAAGALGWTYHEYRRTDTPAVARPDVPVQDLSGRAG